MYTQEDLSKAILEGDSAKVGEIASYFARQAQLAASAQSAMAPPQPEAAKAAPKTAKAAPKKAAKSKAPAKKSAAKKAKAALPAPKKEPDDNPPWIVPSLAKNSGKNYSTMEEIGKIDHSQVKILTDKTPIDLSRAPKDLRDFEKSKKKNRDPRNQRQAAKKFWTKCEKCKNDFEIYERQLTETYDVDERLVRIYMCDGCTKKGAGGR